MALWLLDVLLGEPGRTQKLEYVTFMIGFMFQLFIVIYQFIHITYILSNI